MKILPKFKIGNIVMMNDRFHFNLSSRTVSIGMVEAIHFHPGTEISGDGSQGNGNITYTISGFSIRPEESQLKAYTGKPFDFDPLK